jgi:polysaccharide biosynthesis protein PslH
MRVLWLSHFVPYPPVGGARQRSHHLLLQAARTHEVHVVALNQKANIPTADALADACERLRPSIAGLDVFPIPSDASRATWAAMTATSFFRPSPYDVNWLRSKAVWARIAALDVPRRFDLVHVDTLALMQYAPLFGRTPVALNHHNVESQLTARRAEKESHPLKALYLARDAAKLAAHEAAMCPGAGINLVVSPLDGERLQEVAPGTKVAVVDNGVDVDYFRPDPAVEPDPKHMIFAGGMNWFPNAEAMRFFVQDIWPALLADDPSRRMTIIGRGAPAEVTAAASDRLHVAGFVPDVRPYAHRAGIYVCPIKNGGGTRLKILDALALALPLVATELAVEGLELQPDVHYLRAETPEDYVRQVRRLEAEPELRRRLALAGRQLVERRYSWQGIGRALCSAYDEAVGDTLPRRTTPGRQLAVGGV